MSGTLVLRSQAGVVAEETLARLTTSLSEARDLVLSVEGAGTRSLIENAFLELLHRRGIQAAIRSGQAGDKRTLQIVVLEQQVRYTGLASGEYRREVRTSIETRDFLRDSSRTQYVGTCSHQDVDTVAFREDIGLYPAARETDRTLFDKLLEPILLVGGAFLVVYLFFTVRN
jgi:hypothetical protein